MGRAFVLALAVLLFALPPQALRVTAQSRVPAPPPPMPAAMKLPPPLSWPAPPHEARIRFVRSLDPLAARGRPSALSRFFKAIVGGTDAPTMTNPYGVAVGPDGRLYVADSADGVIHVFRTDKADYRTIRVEGQSLIGIAFVGQRMLVTDSTGGKIRCLDLEGRSLWVRGKNDGFMRPTGVVAAAGRFFIVDTLAHEVVNVDADGNVGPRFGRRGVKPGELNYPTSIASDASGQLFVTDTMNFRVQVFDTGGRFLHAFGRLGSGPGDFDKPKGIAVDQKGRVYVVEGLHDVVQIFQPDGQLLLVFGGSGAGPGQMWLPAGIALSGNEVYVADTANQRIQIYERLGEAR